MLSNKIEVYSEHQSTYTCFNGPAEQYVTIMKYTVYVFLQDTS